MNRLNITAIASAIALAFSAGAMAAEGISKDEYKAAQSKISAEYKSAKANCASLKANAKDVCNEEAKGNEKVAKADLETRYHPGDKSRHALAIAKADAEYAVAKEKCDDKTGADKTACVKEAKAAAARAKADANAPMRTAKQTSTAPTSKKESPGEYVDDAMITAKVKAAVLEEPSLKSAEINVETLKGTVQLTGFVNSRADINKAVQVAKGVKGVKSVKNDMILKGKQG